MRIILAFPVLLAMLVLWTGIGSAEPYLLGSDKESIEINVAPGFEPFGERRGPPNESMAWAFKMDSNGPASQFIMVLRGSFGKVRTVDQQLAMVIADLRADCPRDVNVSAPIRSREGLPAILLQITCRRNTEGQASVQFLKMLQGGEAEYLVVRSWLFPAQNNSADVPVTAAIREEAMQLLATAHLCEPGKTCMTKDR